MVSIPASDSIPPFEMAKYEVTFTQWDVSWSTVRVYEYRTTVRNARPVINVSWDDAIVFLRWLSTETDEQYRLPSNREWTHAALAGNITRYSWGRRIGDGRANCRGCGSQWDNKTTAPVGSFRANAHGLHDMHGNVWEWVQNCYNDPFNWPFENGGSIPIGSPRERTHCDGRMRRGGSYASKPKDVRADRVEMWNKPHRSFTTTGFRVARSLKR